MSAAARPTAGWRWLIWSVYVVLWTTALLVRNPVEVEQQPPPVRTSLHVFTKIVHVSAYALMTVLSGWLGLTGRPRWLLLLLVSVHAFSTEWLQFEMDIGRTGCWEDVGWDHLGLLVGLLVSWKWWAPAASRPER